jgi:hypothetical protein
MPDIAASSPGAGPSTPKQTSRDRIAEEHRQLHEALDRLQATEDIRRIAPLLEELRPRLAEHFASEEEPEGLHQAIGDTAPHLMTSLQQIYEEHREFLATVDRLASEARACCEGPVARILSGIHQLCENLETHEAAETELFTDAVYTDLGDSS